MSNKLADAPMNGKRFIGFVKSTYTSRPYPVEVYFCTSLKRFVFNGWGKSKQLMDFWIECPNEPYIDINEGRIVDLPASYGMV